MHGNLLYRVTLKILLISVCVLVILTAYDAEKKVPFLPSVRFSESSTTFVHGSSKVE